MPDLTGGSSAYPVPPLWTFIDCAISTAFSSVTSMSCNNFSRISVFFNPLKPPINYARQPCEPWSSMTTINFYYTTHGEWSSSPYAAMEQSRFSFSFHETTIDVAHARVVAAFIVIHHIQKRPKQKVCWWMKNFCSNRI